jgi:hypothetical protein
MTSDRDTQTGERLSDLEQLYGIKFSPAEWVLLTNPPHMLDPIERQQRYLLQMHLLPLSCPACSGWVCVRSARLGDGREQTSDDDYQCNLCQAKLTWHLGLVGPEQWFTLSPDQVVTVPPKRPWPLPPGATDPRD